MATALGSSSSVSTWGKFRCAWDIYTDLDVHYYASTYSITYFQGFKSAADGTGLIRYAPYGVNGAIRQPGIFNKIYTISFPPPVIGNYMSPIPLRLISGTSYESAAATVEVQSLLTGQTVSFSNGQSATIDSVLWTAGRQDWTSSATSQPYVSSITYMEAFSTPA